MRKPCPSCPWRVSTRTADIPGGALDHAKGRAFMDPTSVKAMGCHLGCEPGTATSTPCAGFVLQVGTDNIGIRLALMRGWFKLSDFGTDAPLHPTFDAMLAAHPDPSEIGMTPSKSVISCS
jgi:hypothetical protein